MLKTVYVFFLCLFFFFLQYKTNNVPSNQQTVSIPKYYFETLLFPTGFYILYVLVGIISIRTVRAVEVNLRFGSTRL